MFDWHYLTMTLFCMEPLSRLCKGRFISLIMMMMMMMMTIGVMAKTVKAHLLNSIDYFCSTQWWWVHDLINTLPITVCIRCWYMHQRLNPTKAYWTNSINVLLAGICPEKNITSQQLQAAVQSSCTWSRVNVEYNYCDHSLLTKTEKCILTTHTPPFQDFGMST